ncbi:MerR family transcriptional regulator [Streptomyces sp. SID5785]|uniref:MerR family transcriptional regulator n=1 Tax=Streptomyces sp. SID5785 TaxID=2690309 RepID=UPI001360F554|nr:MerR family transcriptional regulator [Streptomyces sp. SID5785]MZD04244.1 MerR family transcriptional regulator [Streptomyces sp. SID5785]
MFTIGDFARHGRVSVRMLRHYDATGLLRPDHVDPVTGYRHYAAAQLDRLNRLIALKELGFTLAQVGEILDEKVDAAQLRAMLRLRRAELAAEMAATAARLGLVEARLRSIERETAVSVDDIVIKHLPGRRVAELTAVAPDFDTIGPVIQPLYEELFRRLGAAGIAPSGPGVARYEDAPDGGVLIHAGVEVTADPREDDGLRVLDLPPVTRAATLVHRGSMESVLTSVQALAHWIDENGHRSAGYPREINLECPENLDDWVTELQEPLA